MTYLGNQTHRIQGERERKQDKDRGTQERGLNGEARARKDVRKRADKHAGAACGNAREKFGP